MKKFFAIIFLSALIFKLSAQTLTFTDYKLRECLPDWVVPITEQIKIAKTVYVDGTINPFFLEADFNGDSEFDIALFVKEKTTDKKGILIIHGKSFKTYLIGAGEKFAHIGDNFEFLEIWKIYREKEAALTIFADNGDIEGNKTIEINLPAILVAASESSSNLIIWEKDKYVWLHTGD